MQQGCGPPAPLHKNPLQETSAQECYSGTGGAQEQSPRVGQEGHRPPSSPERGRKITKRTPDQHNCRHRSSRSSWASPAPFGSHLGPSWGRLGAILGHLGPVLGPSWGQLGPSWGQLRPSWGHLGPVLGPSWAHLWPSWAHLWPSWRMLLLC